MIQKVQSLWNFPHQESCDRLESGGMDGEGETIMQKDVGPAVLSHRSIYTFLFVMSQRVKGYACY